MKFMRCNQSGGGEGGGVGELGVGVVGGVGVMPPLYQACCSTCAHPHSACPPPAAAHLARRQVLVPLQRAVHAPVGSHRGGNAGGRHRRGGALGNQDAVADLSVFCENHHCGGLHACARIRWWGGGDKARCGEVTGRGGGMHGMLHPGFAGLPLVTVSDSIIIPASTSNQ